MNIEELNNAEWKQIVIYKPHGESETISVLALRSLKSSTPESVIEILYRKHPRLPNAWMFAWRESAAVNVWSVAYSLDEIRAESERMFPGKEVSVVPAE